MSTYLQTPTFQPIMGQQGTSPLVSELMKLFGGSQPPSGSTGGTTQPKATGNPIAALSGANGQVDLSELIKKVMELWAQGSFGPSAGMPFTALQGKNVASGSQTDSTAE